MFNKISIFTKLTITISFCLIIILLIVGILIINLQENSLIEEKKKSAERMALLFSKISAFHIEKYSYYVLDENTIHLQSKIDNEVEILSVIVRDRNGKKINPSGFPVDKINIPKRYQLKIEKECKSSNGEIIGKVEMIFSLESIYKKILSIRIIYISIVFFTILILNGILALLIYFIINKPLKNLTLGVQSVGRNNFDISIESNRNDEIGFLTKAFINMTKDLKNSFIQIENHKKEIENYSKNLEILVQERTKQLEDSNKELIRMNEKMKTDLKIAQKIQLAIIPKILPITNFFILSGKYLPMDELGGDYYDVFQLDEKKIAILIADVCGHGVPAALITSMAKFSFRNNSLPNKTTGEIVKSVNEELYNIIGKEEYLTAFYGIIDTEKGILEYTNAGHNDVYIFRENGKIESLPANSYLIGFINNLDFNTNSFFLEKGDRIVLYTDGIPEAKNSNKELFGYSKLKEILNSTKNLSPEQSIEVLVNEVKNYIKDYPQNDDMTILIADIVKEGDVLKIDFGFVTEKLLKEIACDSNDSNEVFKNIKETNKLLFEAIENYKLGKYEKAKAILLTIKNRYKRKSDNLVILNILGYCFYKLNDFDNALKSWEEALLINPESNEIKNNIQFLKDKIQKS